MFEFFFEEADVSKIFSPDKQEKTGGLYLGSILTIQNSLICKYLNIKSVISLTDSASSRNLYDYNNLKLSQSNHLIIAVNDSKDENLQQYFLKAFEFIESKRSENQNVLVHCTAGCSRSPTIVIAYLMQKFYWTLREAIKFVEEKRPFISPNENFMNQLEEFEKTRANGQSDQSNQNISVDSLDSV